MADRRVIETVLAGKETISPAAAKAGRAIDQLGDQMDGAARDAKNLDQQIEDLNRSLAALAAAYAATGDKSIFGDIRKQQGELRRLLNVKKLLGDAGDEGATAFSARFAQRIGPLLLNAPVSAPLIAGAVGAAPVISSVISAAVSGGVALAGVGAGLAIAFRDPTVKAEAHDAAADIGDIFKDAAKPFVPEAIKSIGIVRAEIRKLKPEFEAIFATSAGYSDTLVGSLGAAIDELVPDLRQVVQNAEPVVNVLGEHIPKAASSAGDALKILSSDSKTAADALDGLLTSTEFLIGGTATVVSTLNKIGPAVASPLYLIGALNEETKKTGDEFHEAVSWSGQASAGFEFTAEALAKMTDEQRAAAEAQMASTAAARQAVDAYKTLSEQMRDAAGANQSYLGGMIGMEDAIDGATAALKENGKTAKNHGAQLDLNTAKGRANAAALNTLASSTLNARDKTLALKGTQGEVNAIMQRGYNQFVAAARGMGLSKSAADALARSLGLIPPAKNTKATVDAATAIRRAQQLRNELDAIHSKTVYINVATSKGFGGFHGFSHGGEVPGPPVNRDVVPALLTPREGVLTVAGMKRIGGRAGLAAINRGTPGPVYPAAPAGGLDVKILAAAMRAALVGVTVTMDGRAVGQLTGRTADMYTRGG